MLGIEIGIEIPRLGGYLDVVLGGHHLDVVLGGYHLDGVLIGRTQFSVERALDISETMLIMCGFL
jgi:hypothetical protein